MTVMEEYTKEIAVSISDQPHEQFFVFTRFLASDDKDIEKGILYVKLTDGHRFWRSKASIAAEELSEKKYDSGRMKPALEALTDKFPSTQTYAYRLDSEDFVLSILFNVTPGAARSRLRIRLHPVQDAKAAVFSALDTLVVNLNRLKVATENLRKGKSALEAEVAASRALKQEFAANKQGKDLAERKSYEGIAALLNLKKKQLRAAAGKEDETAMEVEEEGRAMDVEEEGVEGEAAVEEEPGEVEEEGEEPTEISEEEEGIVPQSPTRNYDEE